MKNQKGFTLIELMIVVAIIGILASVAVPQYQDYVSRTKVTDAFSGAAAAKTLLADFYNAEGTMPAAASVEATAIEDGIEASNYVAAGAATYAFTDADNASISVTLSSVATAVNGKLLVLNFNGAGASFVMDCTTNSTVPTKFLPSACK